MFVPSPYPKLMLLFNKATSIDLSNKEPSRATIAVNVQLDV